MGERIRRRRRTSDDDGSLSTSQSLSLSLSLSRPSSPRHARRGGTRCRPRGAAPGGERAHQGAVGAARRGQSRLFVGHLRESKRRKSAAEFFCALFSVPSSGAESKRTERKRSNIYIYIYIYLVVLLLLLSFPPPSSTSRTKSLSPSRAYNKPERRREDTSDNLEKPSRVEKQRTTSLLTRQCLRNPYSPRPRPTPRSRRRSTRNGELAGQVKIAERQRRGSENGTKTSEGFLFLSSTWKKKKKTRTLSQRLPRRRGPQPPDPLLARPGGILGHGVRGALRPAGGEGVCPELPGDDRAGVRQGERRAESLIPPPLCFCFLFAAAAASRRRRFCSRSQPFRRRPEPRLVVSPRRSRLRRGRRRR